MEDISKSTDDKKGVALLVIRFAAVGLAAISLTGCVGAGFDLFGGEKVDRSISTSTIATAKTADHSDEATVQNAVTSADLSKLAGDPVPWANTTTGSAGVISAISEDRGTGAICRIFTTTRHAYDGIASFDGRTCLLNDGQWHLLAFTRDS